MCVALLTAACADRSDEPIRAADGTSTTIGDPSTSAPDLTQPATAFTWVTTVDTDGYGYVLTVEGSVVEDAAAYTMQVEPRLGTDRGEYADMLALMAGIAVNGFAAPGEGDAIETDTGERISQHGHTEVRVHGDDRWYRSPWLLDEAATAMGGAEWVHLRAEDDPQIDLITYVVTERHDDALRRLLGQVSSGEPVTPPAGVPDDWEIDQLLSPWTGLIGAGDNVAVEVSGDAERGAASWRDVLTYEPDGADGELSGRVTWSTERPEPPTEPDDGSVIEASTLSAQLAG